MKKFLLLSLAIAAVLSLGSCNRQNANEAQVKVTVLNASGIPQQNARVHLYTDARPNRNTNTSDSRQSQNTDNYGVATFDLNLKNLNITEGRTNLYFAVFYDSGNETYVTSHNGLTINRGQQEEITITLPVQ